MHFGVLGFAWIHQWLLPMSTCEIGTHDHGNACHFMLIPLLIDISSELNTSTARATSMEVVRIYTGRYSTSSPILSPLFTMKFPLFTSLLALIASFDLASIPTVAGRPVVVYSMPTKVVNLGAATTVLLARSPQPPWPGLEPLTPS
ncbi:hypothetical protein K438DRAFT_1988978 [Mycena galopus ATCC 62051]|nr:hypothetical protein K438DRAFT_1988978 [Mycena galopus ATCC 62051]